MALIFSLLFISLLTQSTTEAATSSGLAIDLIHRDSPLSPLFNPNHSYFDRQQGAYRRSIARANRFSPRNYLAGSVQSAMVSADGEYLMKVSLGSPPTEVLAIADTGSDLIWFQCKPCSKCNKQHSLLFDSSKSSTYNEIGCGTNYCNELDSSSRSCDKAAGTCKYTYSYGDGSYTEGNLATEKFTIGAVDKSAPLELPKVVFGCGRNNGGTFDESSSGIIGLGGGELSLVSQLGKAYKKFSYCLVPATDESNITGKIRFGLDSIMSDSVKKVSTPLVSKAPDTYYYVTLEAISVGSKKLLYKNSNRHYVQKGNMIVDSGTTLTFLNPEFFYDLESELEKSIKATRVNDPKHVFQVCFEGLNEADIPVITAHFTNADVKLLPLNTFVRTEEGLICFTMIPSNDIAIFGNLSQMDFLVGYDLEERLVSFQPADCAKP